MTDVYALGSCRLRAPLMHLHRAGVITFTNAQSSWYSHTIGECVQRVAMTDGDMACPAALRHLILNRDSCSSDWSDGPAAIRPGSLAMFEVSTRHQLRLDPYILHSTCVRKTGFEGARHETMSWSAVEQNIQTLCQRFSHVILVGNIALDATLAAPDSGRHSLNLALQAMSNTRRDLSFICPNPHISRTDPRRDLRDNNHFQPGFERQLADIYGTVIAGCPMFTGPARAPAPDTHFPVLSS